MKIRLSGLVVVAISTVALLSAAASARAQTVDATIPIASNSCCDVAVNPNTNQIYTSGGASGGQVVTWINGDTNTVVEQLGTGSSARVNPATNKIYAGGVYDGEILAYSGVDGTLLKAVGGFGCPTGARVDQSLNHIWGLAQCGGGDDPVFLIDGSTDTLISGYIGTGGVMGPAAVNPVTHKLYVHSSSLFEEVNPITFAVTPTPFTGIVRCVDPDPSNNRLYAQLSPPGGLQVIDGSTESVITTLPVVSLACAVNPTRGRLYVLDLTSGTMKVFNAGSNALIGSIPVPSGDTFLGGVAVNSNTGNAYVEVRTSSGAYQLLVIEDNLSSNQPPVANAGANQTLECTGNFSASATLDGSASSDPDGDTLTYKWTDPNNNVLGTTAKITVTAPLTPPGPTTTTYTLTVTDPGGLTSTATTNVTVKDTTPPTLTLSQTSVSVVIPTASATGVSASTLNLNQYASATDVCDPNPIISNNAPSVFPIGVTDVSFTATDHCGNASAPQTFVVQVVYNFTGFFVPILNDGSSIFQSGRTVPVKFALTAADGTIVSNAVANLFVAMTSNLAIGTTDMTDATASGGSDTGNLFRFDPTSGQYIFNLSTNGFAGGTWLVRATINDGTVHNVLFSIR